MNFYNSSISFPRTKVKAFISVTLYANANHQSAHAENKLTEVRQEVVSTN